MGAFILFDIGFKDKISRLRFEKKYKPKIIVDQNSNSGGFAAWTIMRNATIDVVYDMGFMGYAEPQYILKECLTGRTVDYNGKKGKEEWSKVKKKDIIKIKFLAWIPINDRNSHWEKIRGRWER